MKYIPIILVTCCILLLGNYSRAQEGRTSFNFNYAVQTPTGSFKNLVDKTSYRGWNASIMYGINDKISLGVQAGFSDYYEKFPRQVYNLSGGGHISAVMTNSIQTMPVMVKASYHILPEAVVRPYVALGAGGNIIFDHQYLGEFISKNTSSIGFAAATEAGVLIPFRKYTTSGITLGANYHLMPFNKNGISNLNNWGIFAGISLPLK